MLWSWGRKMLNLSSENALYLSHKRSAMCGAVWWLWLAIEVLPYEQPVSQRKSAAWVRGTEMLMG